jgi:hypothetical protein
LIFLSDHVFVVPGARFCFELDEELGKAASDEDVKVAIAEKISRERIGHEVCLSYYFVSCILSHFFFSTKHLPSRK